MVAKAVDRVDSDSVCAGRGDWCGACDVGVAADAADDAEESGGDAFGAVSFSGGVGSAGGVFASGSDRDGWRVADSLSSGADEAGCQAECAADVDGAEL